MRECNSAYRGSACLMGKRKNKIMEMRKALPGISKGATGEFLKIMRIAV